MKTNELPSMKLSSQTASPAQTKPTAWPRPGAAEGAGRGFAESGKEHPAGWPTASSCARALPDAPGCHPRIRAPPWTCSGCRRSSARAHTDVTAPSCHRGEQHAWAGLRCDARGAGPSDPSRPSQPRSARGQDHHGHLNESAFRFLP